MDNIVTTITSLGVAETKNDLATFAVNLKAKGETLESSKAQIKEKSFNFLRDLNNFKMTLDDVIHTEFCNYKLEHRENGERYDAGFQSTCSLTWTLVIEKSALDDIYRFCLETDSNMLHPSFSAKNHEALFEIAMQKAADSAKEKLAKECSLLNVNPHKLKVLNWSFGSNSVATSNSGSYYGPTGPTGAIGSTGPQGPVGYAGRASVAPVIMKLGSIYQELVDYKSLNPGNAIVTVPLQIKYIWNE